jgi:hypothetical protein
MKEKACTCLKEVHNSRSRRIMYCLRQEQHAVVAELLQGLKSLLVIATRGSGFGP